MEQNLSSNPDIQYLDVSWKKVKKQTPASEIEPDIQVDWGVGENELRKEEAMNWRRKGYELEEEKAMNGEEEGVQVACPTVPSGASQYCPSLVEHYNCGAL